MYLLILLLLLHNRYPLYVDSARILGVFSVPSISHQVVFRALTLELAKRGHELVVFTPDPALPKERPPDNITEIDTSESYKAIARLMGDLSKGNHMKRGTITDVSAMLQDQFMIHSLNMVTAQLDMPQVKKILDDTTQHFDLAIVEAVGNYALIVGKMFNVPIIQFSSFYGMSENFNILGGPAYHPLYFPNILRNRFTQLSLLETIEEVYLEFIFYRKNSEMVVIENEALRKRFGPDAPTVEELQKNIHMLFLNAHPIFANNRPVPTNVVYLGSGLHLQPVKELPQNLKSYLDNSSTGVIYVSLGTNVRPSMMHQEFLQVFLRSFESLPYDILWKFDGDNHQNVPKNVKIQKWFPQRDLLVHPKIKVFVTQGGMQSTDEAIDSGVPLVGIPMLGDQWYNVHKYEELGIGIRLKPETMTTADLVAAVKKVLNDDQYRINIRRLKEILQDQPQTPLEKAVWWTEYVLRHKGCRHLGAPSANKTLAEYYMLDVVAIVLSGVFIIIAVIVVVLFKLFSALNTKTTKTKLN